VIDNYLPAVDSQGVQKRQVSKPVFWLKCVNLPVNQLMLIKRMSIDRCTAPEYERQ
jgi:hypothetical protein